MTRTGPAAIIRICGVCRAWYGDDEDGRKAHRAALGHVPRPADPPTQPEREEEA